MNSIEALNFAIVLTRTHRSGVAGRYKRTGDHLLAESLATHDAALETLRALRDLIAEREVSA